LQETCTLFSQPKKVGGYRDPIDVAREKTDRVLAVHNTEPLTESQQAEFKRCLRAAASEKG
jgi:hypothetical protein